MARDMKCFLTLIYLLLAGCAALPPAFNDARVARVSYAQAVSETQKYQNEYVKWGGVVVDVKQEKNGELMRVMFYPLDFYGRPQLDQTAEGYFLLKNPDSSDQSALYENKEIVAIGVIEGKTESMDNHGDTAIPLIRATAIHAWPDAYHGNYYQNCPTCYFKQLFW